MNLLRDIAVFSLFVFISFVIMTVLINIAHEINIKRMRGGK